MSQYRYAVWILTLTPHIFYSVLFDFKRSLQYYLSRHSINTWCNFSTGKADPSNETSVARIERGLVLNDMLMKNLQKIRERW